MSRLMVDAFFPASVGQVEKFWLGRFLLTDLFFPPHVSEICPEVVMEIGEEMAIRQPTLAVSAALGLGIGMYCGLRLWTMANGKESRKPPPSSMRLWALAFLCFGGMNLSALPLHCFLAAPETSSYPVDNPVWWSIDTYMTGASSICLFMASEPSRLAQTSGMLLHGVGLACFGWFWLTMSSVGLER
ncbi:MAG: hypothetical protein SGARI_000619, partial [Bacillariaceae sp.]